MKRVSKPRSASSARAAHETAELADASAPDQACHRELRESGVSFVKIAEAQAPNVDLPILLTGPVGGVEIRGAGRNKATHYLDCRLALTLLRWAAELRAAGVVRIDHFSIYRKDAEVRGTHKPSGHAAGLAIDAGRFQLSDGRVLSVLESWTDKTKGAEPCTARPEQDVDERLLRKLVCDAAQRGIFHTIVTPHHNAEHENHLHLEVNDASAPTWIR